jgi:hypothetical protein
MSAELTEHKFRLLNIAAADRDLPRPAVAVLIAALDHVHRKQGDSYGLLWPSLPVLAERAGTNPRSAFDHMASLCERGYLVSVRRGGGRAENGTGRSNVYRLGTLQEIATLHKSATLQLSAVNLADSRISTLRIPANNPLERTIRKNLGIDSLAEGGSLKERADSERGESEPSISSLGETTAQKTSAGKVVALADRRQPRPKGAPKPWHVDSGTTKETYEPDTAELAYLRQAFPLAAPALDLELGTWRRHEHKKAPRNLRDSFRNWMASAEGYARERNPKAAAPPVQLDPSKIAGTEAAKRAYDV